MSSEENITKYEASEQEISDLFSKALDLRKQDEAAITSQNSAGISSGTGGSYSFSGNRGIVNNYIEPPIDLKRWVQAPLVNSRLNKCIEIFSKNTVGLGWDVVPIEDINKDTPKQQIKKINEEKDRLVKFLNNCNPNEPFTEVMYKVKQDEETLGNGYLEITRNNAREVVGLFHSPSLTMRILPHDRGYIQLNREFNNGKTNIFFKKLGVSDDEVKRKFPGARSSLMNKFTGRFDGEFITDVNGEREPTPALNERASEIIHFKIHSSVDSFYGLPKHYPAALSIAGNRMSARRNLNFFHNDAVGRMAVLVSGGELSPGSKKSLEKFLQQGKGVEEAHKILVLETDKPKVGAIKGTSSPNIELKLLTVGVNEDATFLMYRKANDDEIRECFGLPQIYFSSNDINKASSQVSKKITDEQEFEPDRKTKEFRLNHRLFKQKALDINLVKIVFRKPDTVDATEKANYIKALTNAALITPNEGRKELGKAPYPEEHLYGDKPLPVFLTELQMLLSPATINNEPFDVDPENNTQDSSSEGNAVGRGTPKKEEKDYVSQFENLLKTQNSIIVRQQAIIQESKKEKDNLEKTLSKILEKIDSL